MNEKEQKHLARAAEKAAAIHAKADAWQSRVNAQFGYLQTKYGFSITHVDASNVWVTRLIYQAANTAIYVDCNFEYRRAEVFLVCLAPPHQFLLDELLAVRALHLHAEQRAAAGLEDEQIEASLKLLARAMDEYATDVLQGDFSIFATLEERIARRGQHHRKREQESQSVPKGLVSWFTTTTRSTDNFCMDYLNEEYGDLCSQLAMTLCWQQPSLLSRRKYDIWACAIIHALCMVNNLFDASHPSHISENQIEGYFGINSRAILKKSKQIRDCLQMSPLDPKWKCVATDNSIL
ncbi:DUF6398 domain-containing protein [Dictyobacter kobayashii]|uniref:DUF6398 domain-containing protein n=1 Tax=Dictyobacter kobayashii TaxID=2014872 RepID=A0A402ATG6_9CHLR|nr:DUF6398 domain-containing protein [Dictyobacter kobayashii]GCE22426.1 hypothetical protein KDK_62260 [Dictyobacter kobayashii]